MIKSFLSLSDKMLDGHIHCYKVGTNNDSGHSKK